MSILAMSILASVVPQGFLARVKNTNVLSVAAFSDFFIAVPKGSLARVKNTNVLSVASFSFFLGKFSPNNSANNVLPAQKSTKLKNRKHWCNVHCLERYKPINGLVDAVISTDFVLCENQTYKCSQWGCFFMRFFEKFWPSHIHNDAVFDV